MGSRCLRTLLGGALILWLGWITSPAHAQQQTESYLAACDNLKLCKIGLVCARQPGVAQGICVYSCNPGGPDNSLCPGYEPCNSQLALPGACFCLTNNDCNQGPCKGGKCSCVNGQCVGTRKLTELCDNANPCSIGLYCSTVNNEKRCLPLCFGGASGPICDNKMPCSSEGNFSVCKCTVDAHCSATGPGFFCRNGTCLGKLQLGDVCQNAAQCDTGLDCAYDDRTATVKRCFAKCTAGRDDCFGGETCKNVGSSFTVCRCDNNDPCPNGVVCTNGLCQGRDRCGGTTSCAAGQVCVLNQSSKQGICVKSCNVDKDCDNEGALCKISSGIKGCFCSDDSQCNTGQRCRFLKCVKGCTSRADCNSAEICKNGVCQIPQEGDPIDESPLEPTDASPSEGTSESPIELGPESNCKEPCTTGQICNETTGQCELERFPVGKSCEKPESCLSGICADNNGLKICSKACTQDTDCSDVGLVCRTLGSQQVCHFSEAPPVTDKDTSPKLGCCQTHDTASTWFSLILGIVVLLALFRGRQPV